MVNPVIVCIAKLESNYIKSFVDYHLALGFDKIYLYDNEDVPTYDKLNLGQNVIITHFPGNKYRKPIQYIILRHFVKYFMYNHSHVAHIDIDEYISLKKHSCIKEFINEYIHGDCGGIGMNWRFFGSNGKTFQENIPDPIRFTKCELKGNPHIKTLFEVKSFVKFNTAHDITCKKDIKSTNGFVINGPFNENIDFSVIQLNHYKCKTLPEFKFIRTRMRADIIGNINEDVINSFNTYNLNEIEELTSCNFYTNLKII